MRSGLIMLVDDDLVFGFIFEEVVQDSELNCSVILFKSGEEAVTYLKTTKESGDATKIPDLIFLDINMPAMNGWDFLEEYKNLGIEMIKSSYFVMLSSSVFDSDKQRASIYKEVVDFVVKPITSDDLKRIWEKNIS